MSAAGKIRIEDILNRVEQYCDDPDEALLRHAYVFAANRHKGQVRRSGEAYLVHPLSVAWTLAEMELDEVAIATGLLHDLLEDTETTADELRAEFGPVIVRLVEALTKISSYESSYSGREATRAENFRRMLLASTDDVRVILVKLADRLHNMRTLQFLARQRQTDIARETLEIYAPIANRLGIGSIKSELEDLCFRFLHVKDAEELQGAIEIRSSAADRWFSELRVELEELLSGHGIQGTVKGRVKHLYSIWQKLRQQGIDVANVLDFLAFRIIVATVGECYAAMGLIHQQWPPVPGRIKDYIAIPKPNAYQSLHTTVIGPEAHPFEIQIRTTDMHAIAEHGIAAHWTYKETGSRSMAADARIVWLRSLLDTTEGDSPREFLDSLKVDLYPDEIYCFTPGGDVFSFPHGATVLDFAYKVHTEVGQQCVGARVSSRWAPLKTELKNGDVVEIKTSPQQSPSSDWLNIVVTSRARSKIRSWLRREEKAQMLDVGRRLLERELRRAGTTLKRASSSGEMDRLARSHGFSRDEDLLAAIGFGKVLPSAIAQHFQTRDGEEAAPAPPREKPPLPSSGAALEVTGNSDFLVYVAKCCTPLPGEDIVGYVTRGKGVAVHSRSCPNVRKLLYHPEREIDVRWASTASSGRAGRSRVDVDMRFRDREGMLATISETIAAEGSNILSCQLRTEDDGLGTMAMVIVVRDATQLNRILEKLQSVKGMLRVERRGLATYAGL